MDPSINPRLRNPKNTGFLIKESLEFPEDGGGKEVQTPGHLAWFFRLQKDDSRITVGLVFKVISPAS